MTIFNQTNTMLRILFHFVTLKWIFTKTDSDSSGCIFRTFHLSIFPYAVYNQSRIIPSEKYFKIKSKDSLFSYNLYFSFDLKINPKYCLTYNSTENILGPFYSLPEIIAEF